MTDPPAQNVVAPGGVIVAVGAAFTVTEVAALVELQPAAFRGPIEQGGPLMQDPVLLV